MTDEQTEHSDHFSGIEHHLPQPFPEVLHPLAGLIPLLLIWEVSMQRVVPCRNGNVILRRGQCRFVAWAKLTQRGRHVLWELPVAHKLGFPPVSEGAGWTGQKMQLLPEHLQEALKAWGRLK